MYTDIYVYLAKFLEINDLLYYLTSVDYINKKNALDLLRAFSKPKLDCEYIDVIIEYIISNFRVFDMNDIICKLPYGLLLNLSKQLKNRIPFSEFNEFIIGIMNRFKDESHEIYHLIDFNSLNCNDITHCFRSMSSQVIDTSLWDIFESKLQEESDESRKKIESFNTSILTLTGLVSELENKIESYGKEFQRLESQYESRLKNLELNIKWGNNFATPNDNRLKYVDSANNVTLTSLINITNQKFNYLTKLIETRTNDIEQEIRNRLFKATSYYSENIEELKEKLYQSQITIDEIEKLTKNKNKKCDTVGWFELFDGLFLIWGLGTIPHDREYIEIMLPKSLEHGPFCNFVSPIITEGDPREAVLLIKPISASKIQVSKIPPFTSSSCTFYYLVIGV